MSFDWVRMRSDLYRDPKVCAIADFLYAEKSDLSRYVGHMCQQNMCVTRNVMRNAAVGALVTVWGVLRHRGKRAGVDLVVSHGTLESIDDVADLLGFGAAMASVGWAKKTSQGLVLPRFFEEYNADPATDYKAKNRERQRRYRARNGDVTNNGLRNVTVAPQSNTEKRREENINKETKAKKERPTFEQVQAYCVERNNGIDPEEFIDHYEANGWVQGKTRKPIVDWKAAVRTWEKNRKPQQRCLVPSAEDLANYNPVTGGGA